MTAAMSQAIELDISQKEGEAPFFLAFLIFAGRL